MYYCQITNFNQITLEGEMKNYELEKFQFKLNQTKSAMVFGSTGSFADEVHKLVTGWSFPSQESWVANDAYAMTNFREGKFFYTLNTQGIISVSAICDKF